MKSLGYHPLYVLGRCCIQFFANDNINRKGVWNMFWKYITYKPGESGYYSQFPKGIRNEIRDQQLKKIKNFVKKRIKL